MKLVLNKTKSAIVISALGLLYGCTSSPNYPAPPIAGSVNVLRNPLPLDKEIAYTEIINEGPMYLHQTGGGSMAAGLLGGYLLNSYLISKKTKEIASNISPNAPLEISEKIENAIKHNNSFLLKPGSNPLFTLQSAVLIKADHNAFVRATLMTKASTSTESGEWSKSYFYLFDKTIQRSQLEAGERGFIELVKGITSELDKATLQTGKVISDDLSGKFSSGVPVRIKSNDLNPMPNIPFVFDGLKIGAVDDRDVVRIDGTPGMITFPTVDGIHILSKTEYTIE